MPMAVGPIKAITGAAMGKRDEDICIYNEGSGRAKLTCSENCSIRVVPIPGTCSKSSLLLNTPILSLVERILLAKAGPTPAIVVSSSLLQLLIGTDLKKKGLSWGNLKKGISFSTVVVERCLVVSASLPWLVMPR